MRDARLKFINGVPLGGSFLTRGELVGAMHEPTSPFGSFAVGRSGLCGSAHHPLAPRRRNSNGRIKRIGRDAVVGSLPVLLPIFSPLPSSCTSWSCRRPAAIYPVILPVFDSAQVNEKSGRLFLIERRPQGQAAGGEIGLLASQIAGVYAKFPMTEYHLKAGLIMTSLHSSLSLPI